MLKVKGTRTRNNVNIAWTHGHGIVTGYCCKESKKENHTDIKIYNHYNQRKFVKNYMFSKGKTIKFA